MILKLRRILGLDNKQEKVENYSELQKSLTNLNERIDEIAEEFTVKNENYKQLLKSKGLSDDIAKSVQTRHINFVEMHKKEIHEVLRKRKEIKSKCDKLLSDPEISKAVKEIEFFDNLKNKYKNKEIGLREYDLILKAKTGKTKYSDILVYNKDGQLLLVQRDQHDNNGSKWGVPGGHVDAGEEFLEAAQRELFEETGIWVDELEEIAVYDKEGKEIHYFKVDLEEETQVVVQNKEGQDYKWVYLTELEDIEMPFNMQENLYKVLGFEEKEVKIIKAVSSGQISKELGQKLITKSFPEETKEEVDVEKSSISKEHLQEMIKEHERLIKVISPFEDSSDDVKEELKIQKKELKKYKEDLNKIEKTGLKKVEEEEESIEKAKRAQIGEVRDWSGKKMRKVAPDKWEPVKEEKKKGEENLIPNDIDVSKLKKIGSGRNGSAYEYKGDILKVTKNKNEFDAAKSLKDNPEDWASKIYDAKKIKGRFYVLKEKVNPLNTNVDKESGMHEKNDARFEFSGNHIKFKSKEEAEKFAENFGEYQGDSLGKSVYKPKKGREFKVQKDGDSFDVKIAFSPYEMGFPNEWGDRRTVLRFNEDQIEKIIKQSNYNKKEADLYKWFNKTFWAASDKDYSTDDMYSNIGVDKNGEYKIFDVNYDDWHYKSQTNDLEKSRSGVYSDNAENRRLKRVGKKYGESSNQEEVKPSKEKKEDNKESQPKQSVEEYAKNSSQEALENASKGKDEELRVAAKKELKRRETEENESDRPEEEVSGEAEKKTGEESPSSDKKELSIKGKVEELSDKYKDLMAEAMNDDFSDTNKTKEYSNRQKEYTRYIQRTKEFENIDREEHLKSAQELLGLNSEEEVKNFFGDGDIIGISVEDEFVSVLTEDAYCQRGFNEGVVEMLEFILNPDLDKGKGKGSDIFYNQINSFKEKGFEDVITEAAKSEVYNGYYTWARLGYDFSRGSDETEFLNLINSSSDKDIKSVSSLQELMTFSKGRKFWKENGFAFSGTMSLLDSSKSMFILNKYMEEKKNARK